MDCAVAVKWDAEWCQQHLPRLEEPEAGGGAGGGAGGDIDGTADGTAAGTEAGTVDGTADGTADEIGGGAGGGAGGTGGGAGGTVDGTDGRTGGGAGGPAEPQQTVGHQEMESWKARTAGKGGHFTTDMPATLKAVIERQLDHPHHAYDVRAYAAWALGEEHGVVWREDVQPDYRNHRLSELRAVRIANKNELMLGGVAVAFTDAECVHLAGLLWAVKQAGDDTDRTRVARTHLEEYEKKCEAKLAADVEAAEHQARWVQSEVGTVTARNVLGEEWKARVLRGSEESPIKERICDGKNVVVDSWSQKTSKLLFLAGPHGSLFAGILQCNGETEPHLREDPVEKVSGVGAKTKSVLGGRFGIYRVGQLADLEAEDVKRFQEIIAQEKLGGRIYLSELTAKARDYLAAGLPDATGEDDEEDLEYLEQGALTEESAEPVILDN